MFYLALKKHASMSDLWSLYVFFQVNPNVKCSLLRIQTLSEHLTSQQLEDGHALYEYNVNVNDVIQLMARVLLPQQSPPKNSNRVKKILNNKEVS